MTRTDDHVAVRCDCARSACMFCDGGLFGCSVCGSFEGATTTHCPGADMKAEQIDAVYAGRLDYRDGQWRDEASRHTPAYWSSPRGLKELEEYRNGQR